MSPLWAVPGSAGYRSSTRYEKATSAPKEDGKRRQLGSVDIPSSQDILYYYILMYNAITVPCVEDVWELEKIRQHGIAA